MQNYFDNEATSSTLHATMKPARGGKCLVTLSTYEDRKDALLKTTILDDAGTCRSKGPKVTTQQQTTRQQNDTLDNREPNEIFSHIPKPPPLQMTNHMYKLNNNSPEITAPNTTKSLTINDQNSGHRLSASSQNSNGSGHNNDIYSRPNKTTTHGVNTNASVNAPNNQTNRQTLRLGTVTIGEYRNQTLRREPEKFDFIATQKKGRDSGDTTPTNEALQSELQNTLSRANLRKSNGNSYTEHQRNCPLHQQQQQQHQRQSIVYGNNGYGVDEITKKLQKSSVNDNKSAEILSKTNNRMINNTVGSTGVGILKNGNRSGTNGSSSKSTEKSIKFG